MKKTLIQKKIYCSESIQSCHTGISHHCIEKYTKSYIVYLETGWCSIDIGCIGSVFAVAGAAGLWHF